MTAVQRSRDLREAVGETKADVVRVGHPTGTQNDHVIGLAAEPRTSNPETGVVILNQYSMRSPRSS